MRIPWARPYFDSSENEVVNRTLATGWLSQGENVRTLEERICELTKAPFAVAVNSGTAALDVALKLMGVQHGDEILVPAFAYIASVNCVLYQGAKPVFVDVDRQTFTMSVESARERVTPACTGMVVIDYAGQAAAWDELRGFAEEHQLFLVEDAAPALGGRYRGKALGTLGDVGVTSLHTAKTFTTVEGGVLFLHDAELDARARMIRSHGESPDVKYRHLELGHNYRMTDLHAAVGLAQFERYDDVLADRARAASYYSQNLQDILGITIPRVLPGNEHAWFLYPTLIDHRDQVRSRLAEMGVGTNVSWPYPAYDQPYLRQYYVAPCPITEEICHKVLCLPMYYKITQAELDYVVSSLERALSKNA
jgi:perosamine synthetase